MTDLVIHCEGELGDLIEQLEDTVKILEAIRRGKYWWEKDGPKVYIDVRTIPEFKFSNGESAELLDGIDQEGAFINPSVLRALQMSEVVFDDDTFRKAIKYQTVIH